MGASTVTLTRHHLGHQSGLEESDHTKQNTPLPQQPNTKGH